MRKHFLRETYRTLENETIKAYLKCPSNKFIRNGISVSITRYNQWQQWIQLRNNRVIVRLQWTLSILMHDIGMHRNNKARCRTCFVYDDYHHKVLKFSIRITDT